MLKTALLTLFAILIAVGGGAGSVWMILESAPPFGAVTAGPWVAFPAAGAPEADPYSRALFAQQGGVPLGRAEGIVFTASHDSAGAVLERSCTYRIDGSFPSARFWTLYAARPSGVVLPPLARRRTALHSGMILRRPDNGFAIAVSPHPRPGNWLALTGDGAMHLVLTMFDTPISTSAQVTELELPQIERIGCNA